MERAFSLLTVHWCLKQNTASGSNSVDHWAYSVFIVGVTVLILYLNLRLGFGKHPVSLI